ncbi:MAG TPA: nitrate ABC transporter ATP-binding protein, partial [Alcanivorax sp.]|nr:nitrate ABC transporter ATP-binding protein [Alcanivorax sp.]HCI11477.1 nitrate ABC transporter ATP-binding protein [Alcanivorax sp.]
MKTDLTLGYMPLTDSLPLLAAAQLGFFRDQGLDVTLQEEVSWA